MLKFLSLLISFVLISSGVLSCTTTGLVVNRKNITDQQVANTINQNGNYRQVLHQPENENMASQTVSANIPTKKILSPTTNALNKCLDNKEIDKEHVYNIPCLEQDKIKLNQVGLAHLTLGIAYAERSMIDQAICEFQCAIERNPHHLEPHVRLGIAYGIKGMTNEAKFEFKKAIDIDLNEAVANIVFNALPVAENTKMQKDLFKAHINLGDAYKKESKLKKAQLIFEKALALKPEHPVAKKQLSEIYFRLGTSYLQNQEYDDAIVEFSKTMEIDHNYAMFEKSNFNLFSKDKQAISEGRISSGKLYSVENVNDSTHNDIIKESLHEEEQGEEFLQNQMPHQNDIIEETVLAKRNSARDITYDQKRTENQSPVSPSQGNDIKELVQSDKMSSDTLQLQGPNSLKSENVLQMQGPSKEDQDEKQFQENIADEHTVVQKETNTSLPNVESTIQADSSGKNAVAKYQTSSNYRVYTYNMTRNGKTKIGINEAIKKYEDATINNPYDNDAFLNLAYAYYSKAMYLDDAIARREDAPEGNQNFSVRRFYLNDDTGNKENSKTGLSEHTNTFKNNLAFRNRSGNMHEEMFNETIIEYKNALQIDPNSSSSLYGLALSFSMKGSSPDVALKSKNNPKGTLFGY